MMSSGNVGRPTKYRREYPALAAVLFARGYTVRMVAEVLRVGTSTLSDWKRRYPEFAQALDVGICWRADGTGLLGNVEVETRTEEDFRLPKTEKDRAPTQEFPQRRRRSRTAIL